MLRDENEFDEPARLKGGGCGAWLGNDVSGFSKPQSSDSTRLPWADVAPASSNGCSGAMRKKAGRPLDEPVNAEERNAWGHDKMYDGAVE